MTPLASVNLPRPACRGGRLGRVCKSLHAVVAAAGARRCKPAPCALDGCRAKLPHLTVLPLIPACTAHTMPCSAGTSPNMLLQWLRAVNARGRTHRASCRRPTPLRSCRPLGAPLGAPTRSAHHLQTPPRTWRRPGNSTCRAWQRQQGRAQGSGGCGRPAGGRQLAGCTCGRRLSARPWAAAGRPEVAACGGILSSRAGALTRGCADTGCSPHPDARSWWKSPSYRMPSGPTNAPRPCRWSRRHVPS